MREVIRIPDCSAEDGQKPINLTGYLDTDEGWIDSTADHSDIDKLVYLGKCALDGDVFAAYCEGFIMIYKGHLNSGKY